VSFSPYRPRALREYVCVTPKQTGDKAVDLEGVRSPRPIHGLPSIRLSVEAELVPTIELRDFSIILRRPRSLGAVPALPSPRMGRVEARRRWHTGSGPLSRAVSGPAPRRTAQVAGVSGMSLEERHAAVSNRDESIDLDLQGGQG
jgi:hypothetical protein